jgi:hypothetical protein
MKSLIAEGSPVRYLGIDNCAMTTPRQLEFKVVSYCNYVSLHIRLGQKAGCSWQIHALQTSNIETKPA